MKKKIFLLILSFGIFSGYAQTPGEDCANPIIIATLPFNTSDDTANYGSNYSGVPGTTCGTTDNYLDGDEVVYQFTPVNNTFVSIELSTIGSTYASVFIYTACGDIGTACLDGIVNANSTNNLALNSLLLTGGQDYFIVISTDASQGPQSTTYTLNIFCDTPIPTANITQDFCKGDTLNDLIVTGMNLTWYLLFNGNYYPIASPGTTTLVDGNTYYVTQTVDGCESDYLPITVNRAPGPPTGNSTQTFCKGETLADLTGITGSNLKWYSNLSGTIQIPSSTLLKDGVTYYVSQTVNGCEGELLMVKAKQDPIPPV